jgi:hypothetical protein
MLGRMTHSLLRRYGAAIALVAGALVLAPAAHAHSLGYSDPSEPGLHPTDDIVSAAVSHWTSSAPTVGPPPVTLQHAITTAAGPYGSRPCLELRTASDRFRVCNTEVKRLSVIGQPTVGTAQVFETPRTVTYRVQLGTIGNPAWYEWGAWARNDVSRMYIGDDILDGTWHRHTIRYELSPAT